MRELMRTEEEFFRLRDEFGAMVMADCTCGSAQKAESCFLMWCFAVAADNGVTRAIAAGCRSPVLILAIKDTTKRFFQASLVAILGP